MKRGCSILACAFALALLGSAPALASHSWYPADDATTTPHHTFDNAGKSWIAFHGPQAARPRSAPQPSSVSAEVEPAAHLVAMRPGPSSLALALGALMSLGVFQAGRSIYRAQLVGFVPEWYHTGGPTQIGYATPIDLELTALIADPLAVPGLDAEAVSRYSPPDDDLAPQRRWVAPWWARGPPPLSC
jgi:hypothetical protein